MFGHTMTRSLKTVEELLMRLAALFVALSLWFGIPLHANAQWQQTNGPGGRQINALLADGPLMFAGTPGGVFLTTNGGASWSPSSIGLTNTFVNALIRKDAALFAGTAGGVFSSTDFGTTWTAANNGLPVLDVKALAVIGTTLYVGTLDGVYRTTNNGTTWDR